MTTPAFGKPKPAVTPKRPPAKPGRVSFVPGLVHAPPGMLPVDVTPRVELADPYDGMNGLEKAYAQYLELLQRAGEIAWFRFEGFNFRLGPNCYYRADFPIVRADGRFEIHETKGRMMDDALVKLITLRQMFPFPLFVVRGRQRAHDWVFDLEEIKP